VAETVALIPWRRRPGATLGLYLHFVRLSFLEFLAYRLRYYTGVVTYTVFVAGNYYLYTALFASRPAAAGGVATLGGLTLGEMITYIGLSWIGRSFYFNNIDRDLSGQIREGQVAMLLIKPVHAQTMLMFQALGEAAFRLLLFTLPIIVVVGPVFHLLPPPRPSLYGWTLLSFLLAFLVNAQVNFLVGCLAFYLHNILGVIRAKLVIMELLTGVLVPFTLFPEWVQRVMSWLPFQAINYIPVMTYLGRRSGDALARGLLVQAAWAIGLLLLGRWIWNRAVRHVTLQGG
jgi:ABC-2 type transport system permease protein